MKTLGIICAISHEAAQKFEDRIKKTCKDSINIIINEQPRFEYQKAANDLATLAAILFKSLQEIASKTQENNMLVVITTNSVHRAFPQFKQLLEQNKTLSEKVRLLSMIDATVCACRSKKIAKLTILGSKKTIESNLYHIPLREFILIDLLPTLQEKLDFYIQKGISRLDQFEVEDLIDLVKKHQGKTDAFVFACAELNEKLNENNVDIPIIDSIDALFQETLKILESQQ